MVVDVANFSGHPIQLGAGTPLGEAEEVSKDWSCMAANMAGLEDDGQYQQAMSWEPTLATTKEKINNMVQWVDKTLLQVEVAALQDMLLWNWDVFMPVLQQPGAVRHPPHQIEVEGHHPSSAHHVGHH
jgi:hypothetical protein